MEKILIVDGSNILHKCHFAYPESLTDKEGNRTGAIYGTIKYLKKLKETYNPKQIFVCGDVSRKTFRTEIYPEYKGTRGKTDDDIKRQFGYLKMFLGFAGIPYFEQDGYEADDFIGSLSKHAYEYGYTPLIASGDKDVFQLITDTTEVVYLSSKGPIMYNLEMLREKYDGLGPDEFLQLKALMGDSSDNIPGIKGIGEKTGIRLLKEYGSLDGIFENIEKITGKLKEKVETGKEDAYLSLKLATILLDMPLDYNTIFEVYPENEISFMNEDLKTFYEILNIKNI